MAKYLLFVLFFAGTSMSVAESPVFNIDSLPYNGILLNEKWMYHAGDNPDWSKSDIDDFSWISIDPTKDVLSLEELEGHSIFWFRLKIRIPTDLTNKALALSIVQTGSAQYYLNGKLLNQFGLFGADSSRSLAFDPSGNAVSFVFSNDSVQTLAVKFQKPQLFLLKHIFYDNPCLKLRIMPVDFVVTSFNNNDHVTLLDHYLDIFKAGFFFILSCFHLWMYNYDPSKKANLLLSLWSFLASVELILGISGFYPMDIYYRNIISIIIHVTMPIQAFLQYYAMVLIFGDKRGLRFWTITATLIISIPLIFIFYEWGWMIGSLLMHLLVSLEVAHIAWRAYRRGDHAARIVTIGQILFFLFFVTSVLTLNHTIDLGIPLIIIKIIAHISVIAPPFAIVSYFAVNYELNQSSLRAKIGEIEKLSSEKQQTLLHQNSELQAALLMGQTTERKRVAAELHDNLGSSLSAIKWSLLGINRDNLGQKEKTIYDHVQAMISSAYDSVRSLSHNMVPEDLEKDGLEKALKKLTDKLNQFAKTRFTYQHLGSAIQTDAMKSFELYNVALELCNNILKHSDASMAVIETELENSRIFLRIWDNGDGFNVEKTAEGKGLKNIENRILSINGILKVSSGNGAGTKVEAEITL